MMVKEIRLRPHHGLCIQNYTGQGYSSQFIENMDHIVKILNDNPKQEIILCAAADVLCNFCPNNQDGVCESEEKVARYDKECLARCSFHDGQRLSWDLFKETLAETVIKSSMLKHICKDCSWLSLCEKV